MIIVQAPFPTLQMDRVNGRRLLAVPRPQDCLNLEN